MSPFDRKQVFVQMIEEHKKLIYKVGAMYCPQAEDRQGLI